VWCVWVRGSPRPYIGVWGSLWEPGSLNLVAHPRTILLALMVVGMSKWGQGGGLEGAVVPLACARASAPQPRLRSATSLLGLDHSAKVGLAWFYAGLACCSSLAFLRLPESIFFVFHLYLICIPA
jgi:hypothetical protein